MDIRKILNKLDEFQLGGNERHGPHAYGFAIKEYAEQYLDANSNDGTELDHMREDAIDIAHVGDTFLTQGMEHGVAALFALDTYVSDAVIDHLESLGFNVQEELINARKRNNNPLFHSNSSPAYQALVQLKKELESLTVNDYDPDNYDSDHEMKADMVYDQNKVKYLNFLLEYFSKSDIVGFQALDQLIQRYPNSGELDDINDHLYDKRS